MILPILSIWLITQSFDSLGIQSDIFRLNHLPPILYSDFQGYNGSLAHYLRLSTYWLVFAIIIGALTLLAWRRGSVESFKERKFLLRNRITKAITFSLSLSILIFILMSWTVLKEEENERQNTVANSHFENRLSTFKADWGHYANMTQPKIKNIELTLNIFPETKILSAHGNYQLVNDSKEVIDTILIRTGYDEVTNLSLESVASLIKSDDTFKNFLYVLSKSLYPQDTLLLNFDIQNISNTSITRNSNVLSNGTYVTHDILPRIGYQFFDNEPPVSDASVNYVNYFHRDADYVNLETTMSTIGDQVAIAPGHLISKSKEGKRVVFKYQTPTPVKMNFSFHSGRFERFIEDYGDIQLEIWYKKGHNHNLTQMMNGVKAALDFNSNLFDSYPYNEIRIIEFPHTEADYAATLTANNIPVSETLFGVNNAAMKEKYNLPFYVLAHELTHEWFGNQVMPAAAEGAKMLTESLTEYITLRLYRDNHGPETAQNFLQTQYDRYNRGKKRECGTENPLYKVTTDQQYIAYGKGAIAFNEIEKKIGESKMNEILKSYIDIYSDTVKYYPSSQDLIDLIYVNIDSTEYKFIDSWLKETNEFEISE